MRQSNTFKIFQNLIRINFINFDLETNFRICDCLGLSKSCDSLSLDSTSLDSPSWDSTSWKRPSAVYNVKFTVKSENTEHFNDELMCRNSSEIIRCRSGIRCHPFIRTCNTTEDHQPHCYNSMLPIFTILNSMLHLHCHDALLMN